MRLPGEREEYHHVMGRVARTTVFSILHSAYAIVHSRPSPLAFHSFLGRHCWIHLWRLLLECSIDVAHDAHGIGIGMNATKNKFCILKNETENDSNHFFVTQVNLQFLPCKTKGIDECGTWTRNLDLRRVTRYHCANSPWHLDLDLKAASMAKPWYIKRSNRICWDCFAVSWQGDSWFRSSNSK
jgi:hypothetical protein